MGLFKTKPFKEIAYRGKSHKDAVIYMKEARISPFSGKSERSGTTRFKVVGNNVIAYGRKVSFL